MFYYKDERAYFKDEAGEVYGLNVTAKDKVTEVRELESVSYALGSETALPAGACISTLDEIVTRFGVSEKHPLTYTEPAVEKSAPADEPTGASEQDVPEQEDMEGMSRDELVALAAEKGVTLKAKDTKAAIIDKIQAAGE